MKYKVVVYYQSQRSYFKSSEVVEAESPGIAVEMIVGRVMITEFTNNLKTPNRQRYFRLVNYSVDEVNEVTKNPY